MQIPVHYAGLGPTVPVPVREWLTRPLALVGTVDGAGRYATSLQLTPVIDAVFASGVSRRDFAPVFDTGGITVTLWAPTASQVRLHTWTPATRRVCPRCAG